MANKSKYVTKGKMKNKYQTGGQSENFKKVNDTTQKLPYQDSEMWIYNNIKDTGYGNTDEKAIEWYNKLKKDAANNVVVDNNYDPEYLKNVHKTRLLLAQKALGERGIKKFQNGGPIGSKVFTPGATYDTNPQQAFDRTLQEDTQRQIREQTPSPEQFMNSERGKQVIDKYKAMGYDVAPGQDGKLKFTKATGDWQNNPYTDIANKGISLATGVGNILQGGKQRSQEANQINESMTPKFFQNMQAQGLNNVPAYMEYGGDIVESRDTYYGNGMHGEGTSYPVKQVTTGPNFNVYSRGIDSDTSSGRVESDVPVANPKWLSGTGSALHAGKGPQAMFGGHDNDFNRQPVMEYGGWDQVGFMMQNGGGCDDCMDTYMYGGMGEGLPYDSRDMTNVDYGYQGIRQQAPYGRNSIYQTGGQTGYSNLGSKYNFGFMHRPSTSLDSAAYDQMYQKALAGDPQMIDALNQMKGDFGSGMNPFAGYKNDPRYNNSIGSMELYNQATSRKGALQNAQQDAQVPAPFGSTKPVQFKTGGSVSSDKAKEILRDGTIRGTALTDKQKRYFGWIAGGSKPRAEYGGWGQEGFMMQTGGIQPIRRPVGKVDEGFVMPFTPQSGDKGFVYPNGSTARISSAPPMPNGQVDEGFVMPSSSIDEGFVMPNTTKGRMRTGQQLTYQTGGQAIPQQAAQPQMDQQQQAPKQQTNRITLPNYNDQKSRSQYAQSFRDKYGKESLKGYGDIPLRVNEKPIYASDTSKNLAIKNAKAVGLDPALFYASSMVEGQSGLYSGATKTDKGEPAWKGNTGDKDFPISGLWGFGLDSFQDYYPALKKKGYLPKDFDKNFKIWEKEGGPLGANADPETVMFKNTDAGVQAKAAMMRAFYDEVDDYAKKKNIKLSPEQRNFFGLAHFNSGAHGYEMLDAYNNAGLLKDDTFINKMPNIPIKGVSEKLHKQIYGNIAPRLAAAKGLKEEGLFDNGQQEQMQYGGYDPELADGYVPQYSTGGKWIQDAVNPEHKGYCTPMSKSTCTPRRKALAERFKHGDLSKKQDGGYSHDSRKLPYYQEGGYGVGDEVELTPAQITKLRQQGYQIEEI